MAITVSIQNKGGKEIVKGGLEVSSEVSLEIPLHSARSLCYFSAHVSSPQDENIAFDVSYPTCLGGKDHVRRVTRRACACMQGTVDDLKRAFHKAKPQFYPARQRFTFPLKAGEKKPTALAAGKKLSDYDLNDGTVLIFKDLGPQVLIGHRLSKCL